MPASSALLQVCRAARSRYQRGMLTWLHAAGDPAGLPEMRGALRDLAPHLESGEYAHPFWATAQTFLRAISDGALTVNGETRRLCARIDLQMRNVLEDSRDALSTLEAELGELLRQGSGHPPPPTELISLLQPPPPPQLDEAAVTQWQEGCRDLEAAWNGADDAHGSGFRRAVTTLCSAATRLNLPETLALTEGLAEVADRLESPGAADDPYLRAAMAATLELLGEKELLGLAPFAQRVDLLLPRLAAPQPQAPRPSPTLVKLFAQEVGEQVDVIRDELDKLDPDPEAIAKAALALAEQAGHLGLTGPRRVGEGLARVAAHARGPHPFEAPALRQVLENTLGELETMAEFLSAGHELPEGEEEELLRELKAALAAS